MVKIAVLGDTESIKGFAAVGLDIYPCDTDAESAAELKKIVNAGYGVIFVTERLVPFLQKEIERVNRQLSPSVVPITGVSCNNGSGVAALKCAVEKAVGSDIIFNR